MPIVSHVGYMRIFHSYLLYVKTKYSIFLHQKWIILLFQPGQRARSSRAPGSATAWLCTGRSSSAARIGVLSNIWPGCGLWQLKRQKWSSSHVENCRLSLTNIICLQSSVIPHTMPLGTAGVIGTVGLGFFSKLHELEHLSVLCYSQESSKLGGLFPPVS